MHYYQFNIGDYASHTRGLSLFEDLAYRRLIDEYYLSERPFNGSPTDVARLIGMIDQVDAVEYVLTRYFKYRERAFHHQRIDDDIAEYKVRQENSSKAGKASAEIRRNKGLATDAQQAFNECSTDVQPTNNQEPITNNQEPIKPLGAKRATQLPKDWEPNQAHIELANQVGILIAQELAKFKDYCAAKGATYKDWDAAFRNWIRNASRYTHSVKPTTTKARHSFKDVDYGESGKI